MVENNLKNNLQTVGFRQEVKERSDQLMNYFLPAYFMLGLVLAIFYDTWLIAIGVGSLSLIAYYSVKIALPDSDLYQYVLSTVLGIFMAQYIYQMHGLFEMHFVAFIGSPILITYQKWKLQVPMLVFVIIHHAALGYLQNIGFEEAYFTQLDYIGLQTFIIHVILAGVIFFISGLWAYQLKKYNELRILQASEVARLQKEAVLSVERRRNEQALEIANGELKKSNLELDKFVYSVSHDLRAPLTSMLGLIEISEDGVDDPFLAKNLSLMKVSINKLDNFIEDILNYSRNSRTEILTEEIDFSEMMDEIVSSLKYMTRDGREVNINIEPNSVPFYSDKRRLSIVLHNLVANAIRYHNAQAASSYINVKAEANEAETVIIVEDNGIGIKKELQDRIFEMFYRVSKSSQGSGLGLYIVKQIIEKLKGRIEVRSELGRGATFTIYLPNVFKRKENKHTKINELCTTG